MAAHSEAQFLTTQWTRILGAEDDSSDSQSQALVTLCENYHYPVYVFIRDRCRDPEEAHDLTQGFFESLIKKKLHREANPERGRFRTFLLATVKNYLKQRYRHDNRQKRSGGKIHLSIDLELSEEHYRSELATGAPSDSHFDQKWAVAVFDRVWGILEKEYEQTDQLDRFDALRPTITNTDEDIYYDELSAQLGISVSGVKSAAFRMKSRFRELFRATVAQLVDNPGEVDEEIRYLMKSLLEGQSE